jgi:peroxiredoxin
MRPLLTLAALGLFLAATPHQLTAQAPALHLETSDGQVVDPFAAGPSARAVVFVFTSVECPISNRYAPEIRRLHDRFTGEGASFWLVYPNAAETPDRIRQHMKEYGYPMRALRDPKHRLVKLAGATITPEAAVYGPQRRLAYRGRIDDRYVAIGLERPAATRHDLQDAVAATLAGQPVKESRLQAVGCYIADFSIE